jgi:hypothetical protein
MLASTPTPRKFAHRGRPTCKQVALRSFLLCGFVRDPRRARCSHRCLLPGSSRIAGGRLASKWPYDRSFCAVLLRDPRRARCSHRRLLRNVSHPPRPICEQMALRLFRRICKTSANRQIQNKHQLAKIINSHPLVKLVKSKPS